MASKGLRVISYQVTRKVEASYKLSHTIETLNGYTACWALAIIFSFSLFLFSFQLVFLNYQQIL